MGEPNGPAGKPNGINGTHGGENAWMRPGPAAFDFRSEYSLYSTLEIDQMAGEIVDMLFGR